MQPAGNHHFLNYSYEEYRVNRNSITNCKIGHYVVYQLLGNGNYGAVYRGIDEQTQRVVAVKVLDLCKVNQQINPRLKEILKRLCRTESEIMMACNNEHLIKCYEVYENQDLKIMIIEYCNGDTLHKEIQNKVRIPQRQAIQIIKQVINGICRLHQKRIIHRDLKAENIMIHNGVYKIADFGFSKQLEFEKGEEIKATTLGTLTTMAPQVMNRQCYGLKADIWSIGIIFFQIIFGKVPYSSMTSGALYLEIQSKRLFKEQQLTFNGYKASKQATAFLKSVLVIDSKQRLDWNSLASHDIFRDSTGTLTNDFRLNFDVDIPNLELDVNEDAREKNLLSSKQKNEEPSVYNSETLFRLSKEQAQRRKKYIKDIATEVFQWAKATHLECLKTELIYERIILQIEHFKLLNLQDRQVIELMYLLSVRCFNNVSVVYDKSKKYENSRVIANLKMAMEHLYRKVKTSRDKYGQFLTDCENKVTEIICDRFFKTFKPDLIKSKDKFLVGVEALEYSKAEQIEFTIQNYISTLIQKMNVVGVETMRVRDYLKHYRQICGTTLQQLKHKKFQEHMRMMVQ